MRKGCRIHAAEKLECRRVLATVTVNSPEDHGVNIDDGHLTLREAVNFINGGYTPLGDDLDQISGVRGDDDRISFSLPAGEDRIVLLHGQLGIYHSVEVVGPGWEALTIDGNGGTGVFNVGAEGEQVTIRGLSVTGAIQTAISGSARTTPSGLGSLTIADAYIHGNGGSLPYHGPGGLSLVGNENSTISVTNSIIENNRNATDGTNTTSYGGGAYISSTDGTILIDRVAVRNNTADSTNPNGSAAAGGGAYIRTLEGTTLHISNSLFADNTAGHTFDFASDDPETVNRHNGGGLYITDEGSISSRFADANIHNTSFIGNTAYGEGGGVYANLGYVLGEGTNPSGMLELTNSTIVGNTALRGGGVYAESEVAIRHSTISKNTAGWFEGLFFGKGGGVFAHDKELTLDHTIVAGNAVLSTVSWFRDYYDPTDAPDVTQPHGVDIAIESGGNSPDYYGDLDDVAHRQFDIDWSYTIIGSAFDMIELSSQLPPYNWMPPDPSDAVGVYVADPGLAEELTTLDGIELLDCSRLPYLPLVDGAFAIDLGSYESPAYPTYLNGGQAISIDTDTRGEGFDRISDGNGDGVAKIDIGAYEFGMRVVGVDVDLTGDTIDVLLDFDCFPVALRLLEERLGLAQGALLAYSGQIKADLVRQLERMYAIFPGVEFYRSDDPDTETVIDAFHDTIEFRPAGVEGLLGTSSGYFGDYRNRYVGDVASVFPNQFSHSVENDWLSDLSDLSGKLALMFARTAAHEHAHTAGLQHYDAYGSPFIDPANTGGQQNSHIMATGSTGSSSGDRSSESAFSHLSTTKLLLSYGFTGQSPAALDAVVQGWSATTDLGVLATNNATGLRTALVEGNLASASDEDTYTFSAFAGEVITVNAVGPSMFRSDLGSFDIDLAVEGGSPAISVTNSDIGYNDRSVGEVGLLPTPSNLTIGNTDYLGEAPDGAAVWNFVAPSDGVYSIKISAAAGEEDFGDYAFYFLSHVPGLEFTGDNNGDGISLLGDYNHDTFVDAADYIVWRNLAGPREDLDAGLAGAYVAAFITADGTGDGKVDHLDYVVWHDQYGARPLGDFSNDGIVDAADYIVWRNQFGQTGVGIASDANLDGVVDRDDFEIWRDTYGTTVLVAQLGLVAVLGGDFDCNGVVNDLDYSVWESEYGTAGTYADANGDGVVDLTDLEEWRQHYGATTLISIAGDFNRDGVVDTADYGLWEAGDSRADANNDGVIDQADCDIWDANLGLYDAGLLPEIGPSGSALKIAGAAPTILDLVISAGGLNPYGFAGVVGSGEQLRSIPVIGADTVSVVFSEDVFVTEASLLIDNLDGPSPSTVSGFSYDQSTRTATWTFSSAFSDGRTLLRLSDSIYDLDHEALDGDFRTAWSLSDTQTGAFPTGDGDAGGEFRFHFTVLAGDTDHDNIDGTSDYTNWVSAEPGAVYVSTTVDELDSDLSFGDVSLREAVIHANGTTEPTTIYLPTGVYKLTRFGLESNDSSYGDLDIQSEIRIVGDGPGLTQIIPGAFYDDPGPNPQDEFRAFHVEGSGAELDLFGATVSNALGYGSYSGGVALVKDHGVLTFTEVAVASAGGFGYGVVVESQGGDLSIRRSVFTDLYGYGQVAVNASPFGGYAGSLTIGESLFALNDAWFGGSPNVAVSGAVVLTNEGANLFDASTGGFFDVALGIGDYEGTPDYVVTTVEDSMDHLDHETKLSLREAIDLANQNPGAEEIWLPAWRFELTRDRLTYGGGSATDTDISFGDLDITDDLTIRGVSGRTRVAWKAGVIDEVFDLLGDYNGSGTVDGSVVDSADYVIWANQDGSGSGTSADWEVHSADGDDDGDVDVDDFDIWSEYHGNSFALLDTLL